MYKLTDYNAVILIDGNVIIPFDECNTDYQQYLAWLDEGNTPEPADVPPGPTMASELKQAQDDLNLALNDLNQKWLAASVTGGATEATKKTNLQKMIAQRREEYAAKVIEIKNKYGA